MKKSQEDILIELWNRLDGLWFHDSMGSYFYPEIRGDENSKKFFSTEEMEKRGKTPQEINESRLFHIVFNEIKHKIKSVIPREKRKLLNGYVEILDKEP